MSEKIKKLVRSPRKNKRFRVYLENNAYYDFGLDTGDTYIDHKSKIKRENYRARHYANGIEKKLIDDLTPSPALYSWYLLWGNSTDIKKNITNLNKMVL